MFGCLRRILSIDIEYVVILLRKSERWCNSIYQEKYTQLAIWLEWFFIIGITPLSDIKMLMMCNTVSLQNITNLKLLFLQKIRV